MVRRPSRRAEKGWESPRRVRRKGRPSRISRRDCEAHQRAGRGHKARPECREVLGGSPEGPGLEVESP